MNPAGNRRSASHVLAIATAVPAHVCTQALSIDVAGQVFGEQPEARTFVERLIRASGIDKRHTVLADYELPPGERTFFAITPDWRPEPGTRARNDVFTREAPALALRCCESLPASDWRGRVTHLVTASCTGFSAPGFDVALARTLALSPRVHRTHVGFMGCYAGFTTLRLADTICQADPAALVLIVHVELCSLHVHFQADPNALIANSLFADGAAAALVGGDRHAPLAPGQTALTLLGSGAFLLPNGDADMTWTLGDQGFDMALSPRVPHLLHKHLAPAFAALLDDMGAKREAVHHWAIHPGGPAILDRAKMALGIDEAAVAPARALLAEYGNMSSATLWFLLDRIRRLPRAGLVYACGFGPGLTLESALLSHPGGIPVTSFQQRIFAAEAMDAADSDARRLERSYAQLAVINRRLSRMAGLLHRHVLVPVLRAGLSPTVLEVGCGGGDVLSWLAQAARRSGVRLRLTGIDADARAVAHARRRLARFPEASVEQGTIADLGAGSPTADYVFCNHVLHHIPPSDIAQALRSLRAAARRRLLVNDLERSALAYALFSALARVAFRDSFVYTDGRLSIRKGFRVPELRAACAQADFPRASRIVRLFPWRVVIVAPGGR